MEKIYKERNIDESRGILSALIKIRFLLAPLLCLFGFVLRGTGSRIEERDKESRAKTKKLEDLTKELLDARTALLHMLKDMDSTNKEIAEAERTKSADLEKSQMAYINIMGDLDNRTKELDTALKELRKTQDELIQAGRLAAVGELAAGVAHEINNPLAAILGNIQMSLKYYLDKQKVEKEDIAKATELLTVSVRESHRAKRIINNLLDFSREKEVSIIPCKLADIIDESIPLVGHQVDLFHINMVKDFPKDLPRVDVDRDQIKQVFINLFLNAVQAMPEGGKLEISAVAEGEKVIVKVIDTGCGIKEEDLPKIYDPFFTTKARKRNRLEFSCDL